MTLPWITAKSNWPQHRFPELLKLKTCVTDLLCQGQYHSAVRIDWARQHAVFPGRLCFTAWPGVHGFDGSTFGIWKMGCGSAETPVDLDRLNLAGTLSTRAGRGPAWGQLETNLRKLQRAGREKRLINLQFNSKKFFTIHFLFKHLNKRPSGLDS